MEELYKAAKSVHRQAGNGLWCVASLDGGSQVWTFVSGKGNQGIERWGPQNESMDAEQRMVHHFPQMIREHGQSPASLQMITRRTPCFQTCTGLIRSLAARYNSLAMITIASWADYTNQSPEALAESKRLLNGVVIAEGFDIELRLVLGKRISMQDLIPT